MICAGVITSLHGVRGKIKVALLQLEDEFDFKQCSLFIEGDRYAIFSYFYKNKKTVVLTLSNIETCDSAQKLVGKKIFIERSVLPDLGDDEFYHEDLIGLEVVSDGKVYGKIFKIYNFGASDILEVQLESAQKSVMFPFAKEYFPEIDLRKRRIVINLHND